MQEAIELAQAGARAGAGGPFGAVVVCAGKIIGRGHNRVLVNSDPTAHAEVEAIRDACRQAGAFHLPGATLYASCEPCPMCLGAIYWARIHRLVYAAGREDAAAAGFDDAFIYAEMARPQDGRRLQTSRLLTDAARQVLVRWAADPTRPSY
jgi:tRNA(Arg) A34 adenosine deaminase TadA